MVENHISIVLIVLGMVLIDSWYQEVYALSICMDNGSPCINPFFILNVCRSGLRNSMIRAKNSHGQNSEKGVTENHISIALTASLMVLLDS